MFNYEKYQYIQFILSGVEYVLLILATVFISSFFFDKIIEAIISSLNLDSFIIKNEDASSSSLTTILMITKIILESFEFVFKEINNITGLILLNVMQHVITIIQNATIILVKHIYLFGPSFHGHLFWEGRSKESICASLTNIPERHWKENPKECEKRIDDDVNSYAIIVQYILLSITLVKYLNYLGRKIMNDANNNLKKNREKNIKMIICTGNNKEQIKQITNNTNQQSIINQLCQSIRMLNENNDNNNEKH